MLKMTLMYPSNPEKVLLVYLAAKCRENKIREVTTADIVKDFFNLSNKIGIDLYNIEGEDSHLTQALAEEITSLKIHGSVKLRELDKSRCYVQITPLGEFTAMGFEIPREVQDIVKNAKERIMS